MDTRVCVCVWKECVFYDQITSGVGPSFFTFHLLFILYIYPMYYIIFHFSLNSSFLFYFIRPLLKPLCNGKISRNESQSE